MFLSWTTVLVLVIVIFLLIYSYSHYNYGYWKRNGIFSPDASFPFGHMNEVLTGKMQMGVKVAKMYEQHKNKPYVGLFLLHSKALMINDLDIIKLILVKDFHTFSSRGLGFSPENDPLANNIFLMEGPEWKRFRVKLTPTFTSSKMKYMFNTMLTCSKNLENYLADEVAIENVIDFKETLAMYTTDIISSCAFGIEANSFKDKKFREIGKRILEPDFFKFLKESLSFFFPTLIKRLRLRLFYKDVEEFLVRHLSEIIEYRKKNDMARNDFLQLLIDMMDEDKRNGDVKPLQLMEVVSQVFIFFVAGFETSSSAASFALYELAKNPEVQEKLRAEIEAVLDKHDGKITYESIREMDYLTQTIEETLRLYPPLPFLFRRGDKDYRVPDTNLIIEKGTLVMIPILGIQRDPNIHESPLEFRPERFSPENKKNMHQFASIPFGEGPRICIGSRFGMLQTKLGLISILTKYKLSVCKDTLIPMKFEPKSVLLASVGKQCLKVIPIK